MVKRTVVRDAKTGRFVRTAEAKRRPKTTETETVPLAGAALASHRRKARPASKRKRGV